MSFNYEKLVKKILYFRDARDWKQFHNPKDMAISLLLEASELLEHFQWKNDSESGMHVKENKNEIADELSDVLYWVILMANDLNIDLESSLLKKIEKNEVKYPVSKAHGSHKKYTELL